MRRKEWEIKDREEIDAIIQRTPVCRIGLSVNDVPYVVPLDFGYKDNCLYFHCATEGKKLDMLRQNVNVCFEMDCDHVMAKPSGRSCWWSTKYCSIIGFGKAFIIEDFPEKLMGMNIVTRHYGGDWIDYTPKELQRVAIVKIEISSMTGKKADYSRNNMRLALMKVETNNVTGQKADC